MSTHVLKPPKLRRYHILESISSKTFIPREYQVELLDTARKKNTIVCLGTGTGKTFVAVMLIKEFSHQVREKPTNGGKRTVLLVPTIPLVLQQAKVIMDCTDLTVGEYFGSESERWSKENWANEAENNQVFVMTADIFKMILHHGFLPLSLFNLIIFDECHRAVKNHPYCEIMKCFDVCSLENQPHILGLSASLVNSKCQPMRIEHEIRHLEGVLKSSVETASDLTALSKYGSKPKEFIAVYNSYSEDNPVLNLVISLINNALVFLDTVNIKYDLDDYLSHPCRQPRRYLIELSYVIMDLGLWCSLKAIKLFMEEIDLSLESLYSPEHKRFLMLARTVLLTAEVQIQSILDKNDLQSNLTDKIPPKLKTLLTLLKPYKPVVELSDENDRSAVINPQVEISMCDIVNNSDVNFIESETINTTQNIPQNVKDKDVFNGCKVNRNDFKVKREKKYNNYPDDTKALCGLIFVQQRIAAYLISEWLSAIKENHQNFNFLSPSYIIGHGKNVSGAKSILMGFQKQEDVLQKFRTRIYNLVIATSVIEEGMDIPKCNVVIRFDPPENFRAYIQSKGRARVNDSSYILMVKSTCKAAFEDTLADYKTVEELLLIKCHKADHDMDEPIIENNIDDLIEPYIPVKEDGCARVTLSSAIALVNKYCAKLPSDTFTRLTPKWKIREENSLFQCILKLPINSPLKRVIVGPLMKSKKLAKMAVALQTCIELHKCGELDDNLLPTGKEAVKSEDFMLDEMDEGIKKEELSPKQLPLTKSNLEKSDENLKKEEESRKAVARPGTTKRRMYYFKKVADALKNSLPVPNQPCYLYSFDMKLTCPIPEEQNTRGRKIHDPSNTVRRFGILTCKPIPPICSFPVFTRSGEVTVSLKSAASNLLLSKEKLEGLAYFHRYTFSDVLRLEKYPMSYKPLESEASFYVVPVTQSNADELVIDWKFTDLILQQKNGKPKKPSDEERRNFKFVTEDYQDAVVMPWYRNLDKPQFFYVAEICAYLTPKSDFPDMEYESFEAYYAKKYDINIMNHDQPLLDVDHTSARLNLLTPRYVNRKGVTLPTSSEQTKRTKRENLQQKQILIPELCTVHPFPAYLWRKAVCLPCILYRLNSLLLAEQLRLLVANNISIGIRELPEDFQWPPLDFGWTLADIITAQSEEKEMKKANEPKDAFTQSFKNGYITPVNNQNFYNSNTYECPEKENDNNMMDFEIDVFDPSKVYIPDDDALLEQELNEINFNMGGPLFDTNNFPISFGGNNFHPQQINAFPIWQPKSNENDENGSQIRCGSPSFFEGSGWDSEWDTEDTDTPFLSVDLQGLGYISAPGIINMQSLSRDLASCKDDDAWDSMDDDSLNSDDEENLTFGYQLNQFDQNSEANMKLVKGCEETCDCSWLTCTAYKDESLNALSNSEEDLDETISLTVAELKVCKKKELNYLHSDMSAHNSLKNLSVFDEMLQIVVESEKFLIPNCSLTSCDTEPDTNNFVSNEKSIANSVKSEHTLAFGELLPDREQHQLYDNMNRVSFDENPDLSLHPGPSPSIILQALTMSNANDGINLERLETVGDSFLKYAITVYLFCMYSNIHEGKLSYLRSKQISNYNLYKLGKRKGLGELMVASKFEPYDNWLPPNYIVPKGLEEALIESGIPSGSWNLGNWSDLTQMSEEEIRQSIIERTNIHCFEKHSFSMDSVNPSSLIPYNLLTQHSIPDKSIADCVEALIGAYLVSCGSRGALLFMSWLGLRVLPTIKSEENFVKYGFLEPPPPPILTREPKSNLKLQKLLSGYSAFEKKIGYFFNDKSCLLQAFTHASYYYNTLTDCYQRLEFLGDAVLDYLITRHLYEDPKKHSPGTLTDLRSALVNNTFFASLAVKYDFHKFFKAISPGLFNVINKFVQLKEHNSKLEDYLQAYYLEEEECEEMEDVEVPKALGDIFESVAGAIYLDSNMSLDTVWRVYYSMMKPEIEYFSNHVPKSPIRELLELEPQTAKFERAEMTVSGKVRVCVDVFETQKTVILKATQDS
ncbi:endoribonuclease Dicer [Nephila pilipes]|uniref:Endoribonuclease Dicer n=1 Tax=Nephila pilipes TaxID=299642 RepID=A0A8X6QDM8_NEPPI|nr:endoribonuclease Dicer [Nephila pilipes]GFU19607.1 endoribonuclease Dicer [Nephila pilipes]